MLTSHTICGPGGQIKGQVQKIKDNISLFGAATYATLYSILYCRRNSKAAQLEIVKYYTCNVRNSASRVEWRITCRPSRRLLLTTFSARCRWWWSKLHEWSLSGHSVVTQWSARSVNDRPLDLVCRHQRSSLGGSLFAYFRHHWISTLYAAASSHRVYSIHFKTIYRLAPKIGTILYALNIKIV